MDDEKDYPPSVAITVAICCTIVLLALFGMAAYVVTH